MKKLITIILVTILAAGLILVGVGLIISRGNFSNLFQQDVRTQKSIEETETVTTLRLEISIDNVELYPSEDGLLRIDYWDSKQRPFTYSFSDGTAELTQASNITWFNWFNVNTRKTIKVYLPETVTNTLSINLSSGSVEDKGCLLNAENLRLRISSGNANMKNTVATTVDANMSSGNLYFDSLTAEAVDIKMSSGKFNIKNSQIGGLLDIDMASGSATINDTTVKSLKTKISSGKLNANNLVADSVNSRSASGTITLNIIGDPADYSVEINLSSGRASIEGEGVSINSRSNLNWGTGSKSIYCKSASGEVKITFVK